MTFRDNSWVRDALVCLALLAIFALGASNYLLQCFSSAIPGGWDGVPHYAIADLYTRKIFPATSGWLPEYFAGMPFPTFYPPLFYFVVALLAKVGLGTKIAFLTVQVIATASVPVLTYLCARRLIVHRTIAAFAGVLVIGYLLDDSDFAKNGVTLRATFEVGLSTHALGFSMVLLFYWMFLDADRSRISATLSAVFLGLVPLANVHVVWIALLLFAPLFLARLWAARSPTERRRVILLHLWIGLTALLLSACWLLPMLARIRYVPTLALEPPDFEKLLAVLWPSSVCLVSAAVIAWRKRDPRGVALVTSQLLIVLFVFVSSALMGDLSIQPERLAVAFLLLTGLPAAYCVDFFGQHKNPGRARAIAALAYAGLLLWNIHPIQTARGNVTQAQLEGYEQVLFALNGRTDGRVLVETGVNNTDDSISDMFALQSLVGQRGSPSLTTVFRESSISVLFTTALRNSFSKLPESFRGVDSKLPSLTHEDEPPERILARLHLFNVRYLALTTPFAKERAARIPGVRRISPEGLWELYSVPDSGATYAEVPRFEPVLTFAPFSVKRRPDFGFDFVRLGEELFQDARFDVPLALARTGLLDEEDWSPFRLALLTEYRYRDLDHAYAKIEAFSREHSVVALEVAGPLFDRVRALSQTRPTIHIVDVQTPAQLEEGPWALGQGKLMVERMTARAVCLELFQVLDSIRIALDAPTVVAAELDANRASIRLSDKPSRPTPIWVKQTYFPNWEGLKGEPVYMATPTFQLVFANEPTLELHILPSTPEWIGTALSMFGLASVAAMLLFTRAERTRRNRKLRADNAAGTVERKVER